MIKRKLNATETKKEFVNSIHNWLMKNFERLGREDLKPIFEKQDGSIICRLPSDYFSLYEIPDGTVIEMKFTTKRG